jgi:hypothetical protein
MWKAFKSSPALWPVGAGVVGGFGVGFVLGGYKLKEELRTRNKTLHAAYDKLDEESSCAVDWDAFVEESEKRKEKMKKGHGGDLAARIVY